MKNMIFAAVLLVTVFINASANNYFTCGIADTVRIQPNKLDGYSSQVFQMLTNGYCDSWMISIGYPTGLSVKLVSGITPMDGMTVHYMDRDGMPDVPQEAILNVSAEYRTITASLFGEGYWIWQGALQSYGSIKWEPGTHDMFALNLYVAPSFRSGNMTITGHFSSGSDRRGAVLSDVYFMRDIYFWVGYLPGDVTGDGKHNIGDVVLLTDYLLDNETDLDEFQVAACDVDGNGRATIADVTTLIDLIIM